MKTNYQKLTGFESLAIIFAVVGIVLIGTMVISSLPEEHRQNISQAVQVLDMHEVAARDFNTLQRGYGYYDEFLEKFYVAFTELLTIPDDDIEQAQEFVAMSKRAKQKILALHPPEHGRVLGASIESGGEPATSQEILPPLHTDAFITSFNQLDNLLR